MDTFKDLEEFQDTDVESVYWHRRNASLPASQISIKQSTISNYTTFTVLMKPHYDFQFRQFALENHILPSYHILMLPMLVKSYFKCNDIISSYNLIRQTIPMVYNSTSEMKFEDMIFTAKFLEMQIVISSYTCIRHQ